jgi:hypothetical protein
MQMFRDFRIKRRLIMPRQDEELERLARIQRTDGARLINPLATLDPLRGSAGGGGVSIQD